MVEYILVLAVASLLMNTLLGSNLFKDFMSGEEGFFKSMRVYLESSYRYPYFSTTLEHDYNSAAHDSYTSGGSASRFWGPKEPQ